MTNRREMLLGLMLALGGPTLVASCDNVSDDEIMRAIGPNGPLRFLSRREYRLVGVIADAVIPRTDTPGALDAGVPAYLDAMMHTWASAETKEQIRDGLKSIRAKLAELGEREITQLEPANRTAAVAMLDAQAYGDASEEEVSKAYRGLKQFIASIYYWTEPGATQELHYELVPGRWAPNAPLSEIGRTWAE